jgi:hypothetical protein
MGFGSQGGNFVSGDMTHRVLPVGRGGSPFAAGLRLSNSFLARVLVTVAFLNT